jgi:hypothetical protein
LIGPENQISPVQFDDPAGNGQAHPGALLFGGKERLKYLLSKFRIHPAPVVRYCDLDLMPFSVGFDQHQPPGRGSLDGVQDQIVDNLSQPGLIW